MNRKVYLTLVALLVALTLGAQERTKKFSPEQFDAELQQYITQEAGLTPDEAAWFFPIYKEMQKKQRSLYMNQRGPGRNKPADDEGCRKAIEARDSIEVEQKRIQQTYHARFMEKLSPSRVYDIIKAEDRFHRHKLKQWRP